MFFSALTSVRISSCMDLARFNLWLSAATRLVRSLIKLIRSKATPPATIERTMTNPKAPASLLLIVSLIASHHYFDQFRMRSMSGTMTNSSFHLARKLMN